MKWVEDDKRCAEASVGFMLSAADFTHASVCRCSAPVETRRAASFHAPFKAAAFASVCRGGGGGGAVAVLLGQNERG